MSPLPALIIYLVDANDQPMLTQSRFYISAVKARLMAKRRAASSSTLTTEATLSMPCSQPRAYNFRRLLRWLRFLLLRILIALGGSRPNRVLHGRPIKRKTARRKVTSIAPTKARSTPHCRQQE